MISGYPSRTKDLVGFTRLRRFNAIIAVAAKAKARKEA
jgi:hypothetical protein